MWIYCYIIKGYGKIIVNGGLFLEDIYNYYGGGGVGGWIVVYFMKNDIFLYFR